MRMKKDVLWSMHVDIVESIILLVWCAAISPVVVSGFATPAATLLVLTLSITWFGQNTRKCASTRIARWEKQF
jgi:hypothetical protein